MRRFFAFILCIALCISLLPQAAFATGSTNSGYSFDAVGGKVYYRILSNVATIMGCDDTVTAVTIPATLSDCPVVDIYDGAFDSHPELVSVDMSGATNLTATGSEAFDSCSKLTSVKLPPNLVTFNSAFYRFTALESIDVDGGH